MIINYGLAFIFIPYDSIFLFGEQRLSNTIAMSIIISFIDIICMMDIVINFCSSYQDPKTKRIVLNQNKIIRNYLKYYFWIDLFSSFPDRILQQFVSIIIRGSDYKDYIQTDLFQCVIGDGLFWKFDCFWDFMVVLSLLKFLQMPLFLEYLSNNLKHYNKRGYYWKILKNKLRPIFNGTSNAERYMICFYYTTYTLTLFASVIEEESQLDMVIGITFTLIGFVLLIYLMAIAYMYLRTAYAPKVRFQEIRYQMQEYMAFKHLSSSIQSRILTYFDFTFQKNYYRKSEIKELLSDELTQLISNETTLKLIEGIYFFKMLPKEVLISIVDCMTEQIFLKNDVIWRQNAIQGKMSANYVAVDECAVLVLNKSDFMKIMSDYPDVLNQMRKKIEGRYKSIISQTEEELLEQLKNRGKFHNM
ncbi:unnamed protein product [Diamesa serratosioi]